MRSLRLSKPHVIYMIGGPGAGKSFFAERFSQTFSTPFVDWKKIRDELFNDPTYSHDEDEIVERVALHMLDELFKTNTTILYEGDVQSDTHRHDMIRMATSAGYETLFVWVQVDSATAKSRAAKSGLTVRQYNRYEKLFVSPDPAQAPVVISGKHTYPSQLKIVLTRLIGPRAGQGAKIRPRPANPKKVIR